MQKGFTALPILLGILLIGGLIAYYFYFNQQTSPAVSLKKSVEQINLKSYANEKLGIQFQYSKDLKVQEDSEDEFNKRGNGDFRKNFAGFVWYEPGKFIGAVAVLDKGNSYDTNHFAVWIFENPNNLVEKAWYDKYWYYPFIWGDYTQRRENVAPISDATVAGQLAKSGTVDYQLGSPRFIYLSRNKKMYLFRIIGEGNKILSTFKFL